MIGLITSIFAGPLVGIFGSVVSGITGYFEKKQQIAADQARFSHEQILLDKQISARGQELESQEAIASVAADAAALAGSYEHDASYGDTPMWVNGVLRMVRPALTFALIGLVAAILLMKIPGVEMTVIATKVVFLAEVAIAWWFADRRRSKK